MANHAFGIGDAITGLYTAVGAAELGHRVIYHTRFPRWLARASHPNLTITDEAPPKGTPDMDTDYAEQLRYATDKVRWYASRVAGKQPVWNGARPVIDTEVRQARVDFPRYVVISPFAAWTSRDWPEMHWRRLAHLLRESGREIIVIGTEKEEERIARTFDKSYAYWAIKKDDTWVEWVTDLMLGAEALLGLDSGMIHMAGLLGVPAVSIHAHLPPEFLFSCAPSVRSVGPETLCSFCRVQDDRGFNEGCASACSALATVGPERVMVALESAVKEPTKNRDR
jgi:ADP-heptose:LPS heptosyltransferase